MASGPDTRSDLEPEPTLNSAPRELFEGNLDTVSKVVPKTVKPNVRSTSQHKEEITKDRQPLTRDCKNEAGRISQSRPAGNRHSTNIGFYIEIGHRVC